MQWFLKESNHVPESEMNTMIDTLLWRFLKARSPHKVDMRTVIQCTWQRIEGEATKEVTITPGNPYMHLQRCHHISGDNKNSLNEMILVRTGCFAKLTGKVIVNVALTLLCLPRGMEPGNVVGRREPRRRLCPHPALQGWSKRLDRPPSHHSPQSSKSDFGGDKKF